MFTKRILKNEYWLPEAKEERVLVIHNSNFVGTMKIRGGLKLGLKDKIMSFSERNNEWSGILYLHKWKRDGKYILQYGSSLYDLT